MIRRFPATCALWAYTIAPWIAFASGLRIRSLDGWPLVAALAGGLVLLFPLVPLGIRSCGEQGRRAWADLWPFLLVPGLLALSA